MNWKEKVEEILNSEKNQVVTINLDKSSAAYTGKIHKHADPKIIRGDEEIVRAFLINRLINVLDYKPDLIEIEKPYSVGRPKASKGEIDVLVKDPKGNVFFFIEAKAPDKYENDKKYIEGQLFALAKQEKSVKYLVYYTCEFLDNNVVDKAIIIDFQKYKDYEDWENAGYPPVGNEISSGYDKPKKHPKVKGHPDHGLIKSIKREELNSLATNLHNVLWGGGGTSDTEIFYSLVNIILAKIQDESEKEDGKEYDFQIYAYGDNVENAEKVFERVNGLYRRALREKLNISDERRLTKAYVVHEEKFPLNKLIYTVQALENYSFVEGRNSLDGRDILGDFFEQITRDGFKQTKGQFFTPTPIVKFILYAMKLDELAIQKLNNELELPFIVDPSVGSGTFLIEAMKVITKEVKYKQKDKVKSSYQVKERFDDFFLPDHKENRWAEKFLYGADINFDLGTASKVNMILHGDGSSNIFVMDGLLPFRFYTKEKVTSSLQISDAEPLYGGKEVNEQFDVVASNPPFSVDLDNETKKYLERSFLYGNKKNSENLFVERWYQALKEGGRLGVVLPESVFDTTENKYIRLTLFKYFTIKAVVSLPQLTFEPYTSTKTSLLFAQKSQSQR